MPAGTRDHTTWPADPGHREAIDTVLEMARSEGRWGAPARAVDLLDHVERILGSLPDHDERLRRRLRRSHRRPAPLN